MGSSQLVIKELKQRRLRHQRERQKSNKFELKKQQLCACITLFCTFPRHCTTMSWKCLISRFVEGVNRQGNELSSSFSELRYSLLEFNSRKNCQVLTSWMRENKCNKVWSSATSLFKPSLLLKLPIHVVQNRPRWRARVTLRQDKQWKLAF